MLAVDEVNSKGGVKGMKLEVVIYDDQSKPDAAQTVVKKAITEDKVDILFGPNLSSSVLASWKTPAEAGIPQLVGATSPALAALNNPWLTLLRADDEVKGSAIAKYAVNTLKAKKIAIIYGGTDFTLKGKDVVVETLKGMGITPVAMEQIKEGEKDATGQLLKVKQSGAEVLIGYTHEQEGAVIVRQVREMNLDVKLLGNSAWGVPAFTDLAGDAAIGVIAVQGFTPEDPAPEVQDFANKYKAKYNRLPSDPGQAYYDGVMTVAKVIEQVGIEDKAKIRDALRSFKGNGVQGPLATDAKGMLTTVSLISERTKDGWTIIEKVR